MHTYFACGVRIGADLLLPELAPDPGTEALDVWVRRGALPAPEAEPAASPSLRIGIRPGEVQYHWSVYGSILVRGGAEILYDPVAGAPAESMRAPILGIGLGTLLHQRGLLTLHASAVAVSGRAVAILGDKGEGKSTTSAALHARGHPLVADDVLAVAVSAQGPTLALPAFPGIKLLPDAVASLGPSRAGGQLTTLHPALDKRVLRTDEGFSLDPLALSSAFILEDGPEARCTPLAGQEAFVQLARHSFAARFLGAEAAGPAHLRQCAAVLRHMQVYRLVRPRDLAGLPELAALIEDHALRDAPPPG